MWNINFALIIGDCVNTDNGALDSHNNSCTGDSGYLAPGKSCGDRDDDDFDSGAMCCGCRGGGN